MHAECGPLAFELFITRWTAVMRPDGARVRVQSSRRNSKIDIREMPVPNRLTDTDTKRESCGIF